MKRICVSIATFKEWTKRYKAWFPVKLTSAQHDIALLCGYTGWPELMVVNRTQTRRDWEGQSSWHIDQIEDKAPHLAYNTTNDAFNHARLLAFVCQYIIPSSEKALPANDRACLLATRLGLRIPSGRVPHAGEQTLFVNDVLTIVVSGDHFGLKRSGAPLLCDAVRNYTQDCDKGDLWDSRRSLSLDVISKAYHIRNIAWSSSISLPDFLREIGSLKNVVGLLPYAPDVALKSYLDSIGYDRVSKALTYSKEYKEHMMRHDLKPESLRKILEEHSRVQHHYTVDRAIPDNMDTTPLF